MIIENMEQFGKALDEDADIEICGDGAFPNQWKLLYVDDNTDITVVRRAIREGRVRTKPKTIELYELEVNGISAFMWVTNTVGYEDKVTGRTATATIHDEDKP